jgi:Bifunctional DNA primase/polymerase, N-terminal/Helix-turn-helix domain
VNPGSFEELEMRNVAGRAVRRNGIFSRWQPVYAEHKIATFPIGEAKKPGIRGWQKVGLKGSSELAAKFKDADALGYVTGRRSNVTVLDIDTTDEKIAADAIGRHGQAAIVTRTASGKYHLLYRYNGERRRIRPWTELPIDVLGDNGYALATPSRLPTGSYEIIHGHIDDLDRLKPMAGNEIATAAPHTPLRGMREHDGRNGALFTAIGPIAREIHLAGGTYEQLLCIARQHNGQCAQPMEDKEVTQIVGSVWGMTLEGRNFIGRPGAFMDITDMDRMIADDQDALLLLLFLRGHQSPQATFMCANGLAKRLGWGEDRVGRARRRLIERGYIKPVRQAGRGHPALFQWAYPY